MKKNINLVPDIQNPTPDYYCTWQTQLYATNDGKPIVQRAVLGEKALFNKEKPFGWAYFYKQVRNDLFFVMDDSWDVPLDGDLSYCGSLLLDQGKFPTFVNRCSDGQQALKHLSDMIKSFGWKGLGGWICAQESPHFKEESSWEAYWKKKILQAHEAGIHYWKVDWGTRGKDFSFRETLTKLGHKYAPNLIIEHAMIPQIIPLSDVFRTYDVPAIMSIPMTMEKISSLVSVAEAKEENLALVNCEDEVYIAAAGGFSMGIMRHPYSGSFINGAADMSFPQVHRNLKTKMYEVIRGVRFHKIAPAYAFFGKDLKISKETLCDTWKFGKIEEEIENWWLGVAAIFDNIKEGVLTKTAPAMITRNTDFPVVIPDGKGNIPFVVASQNPNGVYSVATLGRTINREYYIPKCDVTVYAKDSKWIGAFGEFKNLIIKTSLPKIDGVLMQDLADTEAFDITDRVVIRAGEIVIGGDIISQICAVIQPEEDTSEPGVVIRLCEKEFEK